MNTKIFALALSALALPLTVQAGEAEMHVYGTFLPFAENVRTSEATAPGPSPANGAASMVPAAGYTGLTLPQRGRMTSGTSNLGFKGTLEVADHLKVIWQVESAVSPDGDPPNALAGRNTGVGLASDFGTAFYGSWDTPYKYPLIFVGALRGVSPFDNYVTGNPGFNVPGTTTQTGRASGKADAAFSRRQGNSVQYWSPNMYGLSARVAYSFAEGTTVATAAAPSIHPSLVSALLSYENGPLGVRYAFERHNDYFGLAQLGGSAGATNTNPSSQDDGHEVIAWYSFPTGTKLSAIFEHLSYQTKEKTVGQVDGYARDAWYVLLQQRVGDHQLWGSYGQADAGACTVVGGGCHAKGLGAAELTLGYSFALSKTAELFASCYQLGNQRSASYAVFPSPGTVAPGATTRGFGLGFLYTFDASWKLSI